MGKKYNFDYIIIGGGPAGYTAAFTLAKTKKRIALVEESIYDDNFISRDIPYATSLDFAHTFFKFTHYPEMSGQDLHYNFPTIVAHQNTVINSFLEKQKTLLEKNNITHIEGHAHFLNSHTIAVNDVQYSSETFILATGSELKTTGIAGLETSKYLTPTTAIRIRRLPKYAFIIGGGPTGCEIATYYAELGAKVIIMEKEPRLLPREDEETSACLTEYFTHKLGILVVANAEVVAIEEDKVSKQVIYKTCNQEKSVRIDNIILATGFKPRLDCGLENAGVKVKPNGVIATNNSFQTTAKNIYAIGDCLGNESSTERVEYQASLLASNLIKKGKSLPSYHGFARVTNTSPEIATVGFSEARLKKLKRKYKKSIVYFKDLPISKITRSSYGFVKILTDRKNHVIGATIVAPHAGLMIGELSVAVRHRLTVLELTGTPHISNDYPLAIKLAAKNLVK
ncbi:NAD(P)/FAD-dependent oxidoreductase [Candidatus Saccharibacteria bacterium]|nr:NAD(P)/FAD-dependent oxidoreductase [Candidatus Saccharibacteria bacterium]